MMSRDKLLQLRAKVKRGEQLDRDQILALCDHGVQSLVEIQGGQSIVDKRNQLKERERQTDLALHDLRIALTLAKTFGTNVAEKDREIARARLIVDLIEQMLKANGPGWHREWSWYQPRIEEEFDGLPT